MDRDYYYEILGVNRLASQHEITEAYEQLIYSPSSNSSPLPPLSIINHDNNNNIVPSVELTQEERFKLIARAYQVLSDPNKRIQYDREGILDDNEEYSGLDVQNLGGIGRVFGAMISRFGVPLPTQVSKEILQTAAQICSNDGILGSGAPLDNRVTDLVWGWSVDGRVARQDANFYRITVDQVKSHNGFIIFCRSLTGKFKLVIFDSNGEVIHIDEAIRSRDGSQWESSLYFLSAFSMFRLSPPLPAAIREQDLPPVFNSLDSFTQCNMSLASGQYLVCVYGDNFIGKTSYSLLAVPTLNDCQEAENVQELDKALLQKKENLTKFQSEYLQAKENYERALKKVQMESDIVDELIEKREYSYGAFMIASANAFLPSSSELTSPYPSRPEDSSENLLLSRAAISQVSETVGWMTSTLTTGLGSLNRFIIGEPQSQPQIKKTTSAPSAYASRTLTPPAAEEEEDREENEDSPIEFPELASDERRGQEDSPAEYSEQEEQEEEEGEEDDGMGRGSTHSTQNLL